jgi:hypothetical protein
MDMRRAGSARRVHDACRGCRSRARHRRKTVALFSQQTEALAAAAEKSGIRLAVHFEYCLLDEIEAWRAQYRNASRLRFGGGFAIARPGPAAVPAVQNLGSHLLAIRRYAVPNSEVLELACAYDSPDERRVWVETDSGLRDELDFLCNRQPIIQRFIRKFEAAIDGADFPF